MIYFDHASATPVDSRVLQAMEPVWQKNFGNPSSIYSFAEEARRAVEKAREMTASFLESSPKEIIFTCGGTEGNNLAVFGVTEASIKHGRHIIASKIEHDSVLEPLHFLAKKGFEITYLDVDENGLVDVENVAKALRRDTILVSVMYANNEIGTIQPIEKIGRAIQEFRGEKTWPVFHTDACQAAAYLGLSVKKLSVDMMTLSGGKIYGPKGTGALFKKNLTPLGPQMRGGGQEFGLRSGTENVTGIVGFAEALKIVQSEKEISTKKIKPLRDKLIDGILQSIPKSRLNGDRRKRLPNNVNVSFYGLEGEGILLALDKLGIAASSGSACTTGSLEPSHVIQALGLSEEWTHGSLRLTLGKNNAEEEINFLLQNLPKIIQELREISPFS